MLSFAHLKAKIRDLPELGIPKQSIDLYFSNNQIDVMTNNISKMQFLQPLDRVWINGQLIRQGGVNSFIYVNLTPVGQVRIFIHGNPLYYFDNGITWSTIARSIHLSQGNLKRKDDINNQVVKPPYPSGDYELVHSKSI
ncbi:hypothetical protein DLAC_04949 [Tieghemostelium lacteum]|uniref:Uncharacterized protein n=1 Tax=Tieghemostelium lacteum TaxID=361077 RepID=A0A151ZHV4_TIELA|nr:hypothetical protein DLAC_04949 [Tieghemostelium lacteum]|eukprot:KYQ93578.1 hypothetical protein DLAC_04949 [Tieghemostelium lacteum]